MADDKKGKTKMRSPEHPVIGLEEAVKRAQEFYDHESVNYAAVDVAKKHWGYGPLSSSGMRTLAALIHYALLEETGAGKERRVRLTKLARAILLDRREDPTERNEALRVAALNPKLYETLWKQWGPTLPSEASMEFDLVQKYSFNPDSVRAFIKEFKATMSFANVAQSGNLTNGGDDNPPLEEPVSVALPEVRAPLPRQNQPQVAPMPAIQSDQNVQPLDLPIPLGFGRRAILRIPSIMSQKEYDLILKSVQDNLELYREMIVAPPVTGAP